MGVTTFPGGDPAVTTLLDNPSIRPGGMLRGHVIVVAEEDLAIDRVTFSLVAEVDSGVPLVFHREAVAGPFAVLARSGRPVPFSLPMPWQLPFTHLPGQLVPAQPLPGSGVTLRTELTAVDAVDASSAQPVYVHPLPVQERVLEAFAGSGFGFRHAVLRTGWIRNVRQTLPIYQEIGLWPPPDYAGLVTELEVIFLADPAGADVILGLDRWAGLVTRERPAVARFRVAHDTAADMDWDRVVKGWFRDAVQRHTAGHRVAQHVVPGPPGHSAQPWAPDPPPDCSGSDRDGDEGQDRDGRSEA